MAKDELKDSFDIHLKYFDDLKGLYSKYEARTNISINCLNFSVAIWAITTTILFHAHPLAFFPWVFLYIVLSFALIIIAVLGWIKGFSIINFERLKLFELGPDINEKFYEDSIEKLKENIQALDKVLNSREKKVKCLNGLSKIAVSISIVLVAIVITGKISETYDCNIKSLTCVVKCYNKNCKLEKDSIPSTQEQK